MKVPISARLLACASFVASGSRIADIGADHGYLGIWLLRQGIASHVFASDLREGPIQKAKDNAVLYGVEAQMDFFCADGLSQIQPDSVDTVVIAGMGSDTIISILEKARWLKDSGYTLILQPQSSGQDLRRFLAGNGFEISKEQLCRDGGFLYTVLSAVYTGTPFALTPGEQFVSPALRQSGCPELQEYVGRIVSSMEKTLSGMAAGKCPGERYAYYHSAWQELSAYQTQLGAAIPKEKAAES